MEKLEISKEYDLSKLNDNQLMEVYNWLKENDNGWNQTSIKDFKDGLDSFVLYFDSEWYWTQNKENNTCATELFE